MIRHHYWEKTLIGKVVWRWLCFPKPMQNRMEWRNPYDWYGHTKFLFEIYPECSMKIECRITCEFVLLYRFEIVEYWNAKFFPTINNTENQNTCPMTKSHQSKLKKAKVNLLTLLFVSSLLFSVDFNLPLFDLCLLRMLKVRFWSRLFAFLSFILAAAFELLAGWFSSWLCWWFFRVVWKIAFVCISCRESTKNEKFYKCI